MINRPVLRYHGGKWRIAHWVIDLFPPHKTYVEAFGGAASILMRKPRSPAEIYNDLDNEIVNIFRVLRDREKAEQLRRLAELTPFARAEFDESYEVDGDSDIDRALKMIVRSFMGFGSDSTTRPTRTGFRSFRGSSNRANSSPAQDWTNWPKQIPGFVERLQGVVVENRHAFDVISQYDDVGTLFYIDPPYPWSTRSSMRQASRPGTLKRAYRHEMTDQDHIDLADVLHGANGMVIVSGYPCDLYDHELYKDWTRFEKETFADGARPRTEVVWMNSMCASELDAVTSQKRMFA